MTVPVSCRVQMFKLNKKPNDMDKPLDR